MITTVILFLKLFYKSWPAPVINLYFDSFLLLICTSVGLTAWGIVCFVCLLFRLANYKDPCQPGNPFKLITSIQIWVSAFDVRLKYGLMCFTSRPREGRKELWDTKVRNPLLPFPCMRSIDLMLREVNRWFCCWLAREFPRPFWKMEVVVVRSS